MSKHCVQNMQMLGVRIDECTREEARKKIAAFLSQTDQKTVFTPNPEMLVQSAKDPYFKEVLNTGSLNICDGKGLQLFSAGRLNRISGVDFIHDIVAVAKQKDKTIYLLGSNSTPVIQKTKEVLSNQYPALRIVGAHKGIDIAQDKDGRITYDAKENDILVDDIIMAAPDILFVAFGHGKQEKWIYEQLPNLPSVRIAMGVGGSFDFISGKVKRAPRVLRTIGLEWLYRLVKEPKRIKRISIAIIVFPLLYARNKYKKTHS